MKNLLKRLPKKMLFAVAAIAASVAMGSAAIANFGPDRPTRVWNINENGFDYVTYNSYTAVPGIGDERDFLRGVVSGRDASWQDPVANVANNDVVQAKIYIHNNADPLLNDAPGQPGIARDVNVKINIPTGLQTDHEVTSFITASNAQPKTVFDTLDIDSVNDSLFQLTYVPGSAKLSGQTLSDDIFTTGINLEDQKGCFEFLREITFEMKIEKPGYQIQKAARLKGEDSTKWRKEVNAKIGDSIEWRISFQNIGSTRLDDVIILDDLPSYVDIVPGTVEVVNTNNPNGYKYDSSAIQNDGDIVNVNISDYMPGSNAFLYLETVIEDNEDIRCGIHQIANVAYVTPKGLGTLNDNAKVNIINENECVEVATECTNLTAPILSLKTGQSTTFTASASATGTTVTGYIFQVNGQTVQDSAKNTYEFKKNESGKYSVKAIAKFENGDQKTGTDCEKEVVVTEEPIYTCESFTLSKNKVKVNEKINVSVRVSAENGAKFKQATFSFGDEASASDKFVTNTIKDGVISVEHSYAKVGDYGPRVKIDFDVNGEVKSIEDPKCVGQVNVYDVKGDTTSLPETGAGSTLVGIMAAATAAGTALHRRFTLKRQ